MSLCEFAAFPGTCILRKLTWFFGCCQMNPILLGQSRTQGIFRNHLKRLGREVELGTELVDIEQNDNYVICRLKKTSADGSIKYETLKTDYVVGADGTRGLWNSLMGLVQG